MVSLCTLFLLSMSIITANGLTCYKCDTNDDLSCGYGPGSFSYSTTECGSFKTCGKIVAKDSKGNEIIARDCVPKGFLCNLVSSVIKLFGNIKDPGLDVNCYTCSSDKCNSCKRITSQFTFIGLILAVIVFLV